MRTGARDLWNFRRSSTIQRSSPPGVGLLAQVRLGTACVGRNLPSKQREAPFQQAPRQGEQMHRSTDRRQFVKSLAGGATAGLLPTFAPLTVRAAARGDFLLTDGLTYLNTGTSGTRWRSARPIQSSVSTASASRCTSSIPTRTSTVRRTLCDENWRRSLSVGSGVAHPRADCLNSRPVRERPEPRRWPS